MHATRHNGPNRLVKSSSPYLRQHAKNPVDWYPWGEEALTRARADNKPILLSVGYSACYWCHVMEREVFENASIAVLMNAYFINIKVDREERPDLDEIYMVARQLLTQEGGWPNTLFLTPELKPFYAGGTYAPNESAGRPAFPRVLEALHHAWLTQEQTVREEADKITAAMQPYLVYTPKENASGADVDTKAAQLFARMCEQHDAQAGGFFQVPKFPHECYHHFLLEYYEHTDDKTALGMVTLALQKMAAGGIYDHVGCGFHRYAVDKEWYVPHFEKMLVNQAQIARIYTDAARITGNPYFADIAKSILDFVSGPFTSANGGFFTSLDAETGGVEGAYYAWRLKEIEETLPAEEVAFLKHFYALAEIPAFPGHTHAEGEVLVARKPLDIAAAEAGMPYVQLAAMVGKVMNRLLAVRNRRQPPLVDDTIIVGLNGLMIDAFAHAGKVFNEEKYITIAQRAAEFILERAIDNDGTLYRIITPRGLQVAALLEDYAFLIKGLLSLYRVRGQQSMLHAAVSLLAEANGLYLDTQGGYFTSAEHPTLLLRIKSADDSAVPSANAVMLHNLIDLYTLTGEEAYRQSALALSGFFLNGNPRTSVEYATMVAASLRLRG